MKKVGPASKLVSARQQRMLWRQEKRAAQLGGIAEVEEPSPSCVPLPTSSRMMTSKKTSTRKFADPPDLQNSMKRRHKARK